MLIVSIYESTKKKLIKICFIFQFCFFLFGFIICFINKHKKTITRVLDFRKIGQQMKSPAPVFETNAQNKISSSIVQTYSFGYSASKHASFC